MTIQGEVLSYSDEEVADVQKRFRKAIITHLVVQAAVITTVAIAAHLVEKKLTNRTEEASEETK
jgi:hypothetical protein